MRPDEGSPPGGNSGGDRSTNMENSWTADSHFTREIGNREPKTTPPPPPYPDDDGSFEEWQKTEDPGLPYHSEDPADPWAGLPLSRRHVESLRDRSGISAGVAKARGYRTVRSADELRRAIDQGGGWAQWQPGENHRSDPDDGTIYLTYGPDKGSFEPNQLRFPALLIPIRWDGRLVGHRLRPDSPRANGGGKPVKYEQPTGLKNRLDGDAGVLDPDRELWVTEGEKKADALRSRGEAVLGLTGVWNWCTKVTRDDGDGGKRETSEVLAEMHDLPVQGRVVHVVFDSDAARNGNVNAARRRLTIWLQSRGADVRWVFLPGTGADKTGVDDYLVDGRTLDDLRRLSRRPEGEDLFAGDMTMVRDLEAERRREHVRQLVRGVDVDSQRPVDIGAILDEGLRVDPPSVLKMKDGPALVYAGVSNTFFGYGGEGKTFLALMACAEQVLAGRDVAYFNYELPPKALLARLHQEFQVPMDALREHVKVYKNTFTVESVNAMGRIIERDFQGRDLALVVLDSVNKGLGIHGLPVNETTGMVVLVSRVLAPFTERGVAAIMIDHVTQRADTRDRPIGSSEKYNTVQGAMYSVEPGVKYSKTKSGYARLYLRKDNLGETGWAEGTLVGYLACQANGHGPGLSKFWVQQDPPFVALLDLARRSADGDSPKADKDDVRRVAVLEAVRSHPALTKTALGKHLADLHKDSDVRALRVGQKTWQREVDGLLAAGELRALANGEVVSSVGHHVSEPEDQTA